MSVTMPAIKDFLGLKNKRGNIGIEIEVEAAAPLPEAPPGWISHGEEHSLRGAFHTEYITERPILANPDKKEFIARLTNRLNDRVHRVDKESIRTSVHIHCNVLGFTPLQLWTAAAAYWMFEEIVMTACAPHRWGSRFCQMAKNAEGILNTAIHDVTRGGTPFRTYRERDRYAGLNLFAIQKFGSIEFRSLHGTTDTDLIDTWSSGLYDFLERTKEYKSPEHLLKIWRTSDTASFVDSLLTKDFQKILKVSNADAKLAEGAGLILNFAYCTDWDEWKALHSVPERKVKPKYEVHDEIHNFAEQFDVAEQNVLGEVNIAPGQVFVQGQPQPAQQNDLAQMWRDLAAAQNRR